MAKRPADFALQPPVEFGAFTFGDHAKDKNSNIIHMDTLCTTNVSTEKEIARGRCEKTTKKVSSLVVWMTT